MLFLAHRPIAEFVQHVTHNDEEQVVVNLFPELRCPSVGLSIKVELGHNKGAYTCAAAHVRVRASCCLCIFSRGSGGGPAIAGPTTPTPDPERSGSVRARALSTQPTVHPAHGQSGA
ncbi:hypothetical protein HWV62_35152 [Athelia sp. TMB]|nr:hypothetical protein HWV62_35152 [Athelia sp. TMB]